MKKAFDFKLFREGLRQLKLIGWMAFIIFALEGVLIPFNTLTEGGGFKTEAGLWIHPLMLGLILLVAPLMTLYLFHFVNKRNGSDFYHAIPNTRISLFVSLFAAIIAWCAFLVVSGFAVAIGFRLFFPYVFPLNLLSIVNYMTAVLVGSFMMAALTATAIALTGTAFTNVLVAAMLLFVPRSLLSIVSSSVSGSLPFMADSTASSLLNWGYNIPLGIFSTLFGGVGSVWGEGPSILYTLLLGLLYFGAALLLFWRRKSETAGKSAPNPVLQCVFRLILPSLISIAVTMSLFSDHHGGRSGFSFYLIPYVIAVVVYLLYELVTTRRWRNVLRALPGLLILVVINGAAYGGASMIYQRQISFQPKAGEIVSIQYCNTNDINSYLQYQMNQIVLTDSRLCDAMALEITEKTQLWQRNPDEYYKQMSSGNLSIVRVTDQSGRSFERRVWLDEAEVKLLSEVINADSTLQQKLQQLPEAVGASISSGAMDAVTCREIYDTMRAEAAEMDFADWYPVMRGESNESSLFVIRAEVLHNARTLEIYIPVSQQQLPKTVDAYFQAYDKAHPQARSDVLKLLRKEWSKDQESDALSGYVSVYASKSFTSGDINGGTQQAVWNLDVRTDKIRKQLAELLAPSEAITPTADRAMIELVLEHYYTDKRHDGGSAEDMYGSYRAFFSLTEAQEKALLEIIGDQP